MFNPTDDQKNAKSNDVCVIHFTWEAGKAPEL